MNKTLLDVQTGFKHCHVYYSYESNKYFSTSLDDKSHGRSLSIHGALKIDNAEILTAMLTKGFSITHYFMLLTAIFNRIITDLKIPV